VGSNTVLVINIYNILYITKCNIKISNIIKVILTITLSKSARASQHRGLHCIKCVKNHSTFWRAWILVPGVRRQWTWFHQVQHVPGSTFQSDVRDKVFLHQCYSPDFHLIFGDNLWVGIGLGLHFQTGMLFADQPNMLIQEHVLLGKSLWLNRRDCILNVFLESIDHV